MKPILFHKKFSLEKEDLWLWLPILLAFGVVFYLSFEEKFLSNIVVFTSLFFFSAIGYFLNKKSRRSLIFLGCCLFLLGGFYTIFYQKIFLFETKITGKVYVDVLGKVESIKQFHNPQNQVDGVNLVIVNPSLYKPKFAEKKKVTKPKKKAKKHKKKKVEKNKKPKKKSKDKSEEKKIVKTKKAKKKRKISDKTIHKNFVNLSGYQDIDRKFLDQKTNYQSVDWQKINGKEYFKNPPSKISINLVKNFEKIAVNDVIAVRAMLQPRQAKEFFDDYDFALDAKMKKIGGFGFAIGEAKIVKKAEISSLDNWFLYLRQKARDKIYSATSGDVAAVIESLLIGDQKQISPELMTKIRNSGLAHLLSISGFHLSLAAAIFFVSTRFLLSRSQYLALNFDLKKFSAIAAIISTFFYLKIANSPIPAQRAFLMVLMALLALFIGEKVNARRAIATAILVVILYNPFVVFNISFQLSFAAILTLSIFYDKKSVFERNIFKRFGKYFLEIILLSILLQVTMAPFLMHAFHNVTILGFVANILAIPLASFVIMPLGFLALLLMPFSLEILPLQLMSWGVFWLQEIAIFTADLPYSNLATPNFSDVGLLLATIGLLMFCLMKNHLRFVGVVIFLLSFLAIFFNKKPDILFDGNQKFFALYDKKDGLQFSKSSRSSKERKLWMDKMDEKEFKILPVNFCDKEKCLIQKEKKFLILLGRNKLTEICKNDFDVIVNLSSKYTIPECILKDKIVIDNSDFYQRGGHFFYLEDQKIFLKTSF